MTASGSPLEPLDPERLRAQVRQALEAGDEPAALAAARELWAAAPGPASAGLMLAAMPRNAERLRVRVVRTFTVEPVLPLVRAEAAAYGVDLDIGVGPFNVWAQELLDPRSATYAAEPQVIVLASTTRELSRGLWDGFVGLRREDVDAEVDRVVAKLARVVAAARGNSNAHMLLHTLDAPAIPANGVLDAQRDGQLAAIARANAALRELCAEHENTWLVDYSRAMTGPALRDERRYRTTRTPWSNVGVVAVAKLWARHLVPLAGRVGKVLVLDLDNTLWGGVVGEDGVEGVALDDDHPGAAFRLVQQAALDLRNRGIVLALCSKNNFADAKAVFDTHPGMLLRLDDVASHRINWEDKASNLQAIAAELSVGLDSLVFVDDNPVERRWVRLRLPSVTVVELPADPYGFADAIRTCPVLERLSVTAEDERRPELYAAQRKRAELQAESGSVEDFLSSLEMVMRVESVNGRNLARAAQLTQRTNQFNVTTIRRNEAEISRLAEDPSVLAFMARLTDRFGDNGLIALVIAGVLGDELQIDTLLMSCRVIGRGVETALLAILGGLAQQRGLARVAGRFAATSKNAPSADLFDRHGFTCTHQGETERQYIASVHALPKLPPHLRIEGLEGLR